MRHFNLLLIVNFTLMFGSACSYKIINNVHSKQEVLVESVPSGSNIFINGEFLGKTPMILSLRSDISHKINFHKEGFKATCEYLDPIYKYDKKPYVRFGLAKDLGYYYKLSSDHIVAQLHWEPLPISVGVMPFETMSELISKADKAKLSGNLSSDEHKLIMRQIIEMFNSK